MTLNTITGLTILSVANADENNTLENSISETSYIVGRYFNTQPHKEDQIFIVNYTIVDGSLNEIKQNIRDAGVRINISSMKNGTFQIDIPRNYPYSNQPWFEPFVIVNGYELLIDSDYFLEVEECFYKFSMPFSNDSMLEIAFAHTPEPEPFISEGISQHCVEKTIITDSSIKVNLSYMSPLKQYKEGIKASEVICRENLNLILKSTDKSPACVKPETKAKLIERGWAMSQKHKSPSLFPTVIIPRGISGPIPESNLDPSVIVVELGINDTISWINEDKASLTLTADDASWSTGVIKPEENRQVKFNQTGFYEYHGNPFSWASGSIVVLGDDVESLDLHEKLKMAQAMISRDSPNSPLVEIGIDIDNVLYIGILKDELEKIPNAKEYYEKRYKEMIPFDIPIRIEFVSRGSSMG